MNNSGLRCWKTVSMSLNYPHKLSCNCRWLGGFRLARTTLLHQYESNKKLAIFQIRFEIWGLETFLCAKNPTSKFSVTTWVEFTGWAIVKFQTCRRWLWRLLSGGNCFFLLQGIPWIWNTYVPKYTASHPAWPYSSYSLLRKKQILNLEDIPARTISRNPASICRTQKAFVKTNS
jgi:hypothetical protein